MGKKKYNLNETEIRDWYLNQNLNQDEICNRLGGIPKITLQRFLRKHNIKKIEHINYNYLVPKIQELLNQNIIHQDIADQLGITRDSLRHIIYQKINPNDNPKFSNKLEDDTWVNEDNPLFWYIVGLVSSDGHFDKNNCINIFQSNFEYLKNIQKFINHNGKLYKSPDTDCYTLIINNENLYNKIKQYGINHDKRYNVPFINNIPKDLINHYIRGIFDGDGCLYYRYISGMFEGRAWQITTGSKLMAEGIKQTIKSELDVDVTIYDKKSTADNIYYDIVCNDKEGILKICSYIYKNFNKVCLSRKLKSFIKFKKLSELDKQISDIVDASMKIEE
jgi:intein/homing endonuclease